MLQYSPVFTGCPAVELAIRRLYESDDEHRETRFWGLVRGLNYALQMQTRVLVPVQLSGAKPQGEFSWAQDPIPPEKARGLSYWTLTTPKKIKMLPVFTRPEEADANPATLGLPMAELPLEQVMEETLARQDLTGLVVNPWGRSASLEKGLLKGLLRAPNPEDSPGEAQVRQGVQLAAQGQWEAARALFEEAAAAGCTEGVRRLANCCDRGLGGPRNRRRAMTLWKKAAAAGDVLAQIALGDRYGAGTARIPADPGKALMAYRKARSMAELELDITTWPVVCLRLAQSEECGVDLERTGCLLAEAVHGLHMLCREEKDPDACRELHTAAQAMERYIRKMYAGAAGLQEMLARLAEQANTDSLHFS